MLQNSNTSLLYWNLFTGLKFLNELNIKSSLSQNSQYYLAFVSVWPHIYLASSRSQHTLFTLCHSDQTIIITQCHSPLLPTCFTSSLEPASTSLRIPHPNYSSPSQRPSFEHAGLTCYTLLSPSVTFSLFHSELKTHLFRKSYPPP